MDDNRAVDEKCEICNQALVKALSPNGRATRLLEEIRSKAGEKSMTKSDIRCCASCPKGLNARAYFEAPPAKIVLCSDKLYTSLDVEESLVHELVHAYDYVVYGAKLENCMELARSEVRAAREAECHYSFQPCSYLWQRCIRNSAVRSTSCMFNRKLAKQCVNASFEEAMADTFPSLKQKQIFRKLKF